MGIPSMSDVVLYPHQSRMARAAARVTREQLAAKSCVSVRTICAFEAPDPRNITRANALALRHALEETGVRFTDFGVDLSNLPTHATWMADKETARHGE